MSKVMVDLEDLCEKAGQRLKAGTPPEIAYAYLEQEAADIYRDNTRNGLSTDGLDTPGNVGQPVKKGPY